MKAFMVATGEYQRLAEVTCRCFEWATGISIDVVTSVPDVGLGPAGNACAAKLSFCARGQHIVVDADLLLHSRVTLPEIPEEVFAACRAELKDKRLLEASRHYNVPVPTPLFSTGLFVASCAHAKVFARAVEWMSDAVSMTHEETVLNLALAQSKTPAMVLPQDLNRQLLTSMLAPGLHVARLVGVSAKMREIERIIRTHSPKALLAHLGGAIRPRAIAQVVGTPVRKQDLVVRRDN
jgi:hypothetical protein